MSVIQEICELSDLDTVLEKSMEGPVIVFKHSSTCPISKNAKMEVDKFALQGNDVLIYQVVVQDARPLSNEFAGRLAVKHESPQILLIKNGRACWNCSHSNITSEGIKNALVQLLAG